MKIEIKSMKITLKWWQFLLILATVVVSIWHPELIAKILEKYINS
jgi:hypothetical protein